MLYLSARCLFISALFSWLSESNCNIETPTVDHNLFRDLLIALGRVYHFYELEYKNINLDGIYGLRVSQGALVKILEEQKSGVLNLNKQTATKMSSLQKVAANIAEKSIPILKKTYPSYFKKFEVAISGPWKNFKSFRKLDHSLFIPDDKRSDISFDEDTSDQCMTEMTGTGDRPSKPCELSGRCWNLMTSKGAGGYALTHQALFLLIGELQGCKKEILRRLKEVNNGISLQGVYDRICASMYPQMLQYEKKKSSVNFERDLYMEQAMVCGSMGYYEFLSVKRLKTILGWQKKSGCYGDLDEEKPIPYNRDSQNDDVEYLHRRRNLKNRNNFDNDGLNEENIYDRIRENYRVGATSRKLMGMRTMRSLLVEKALNGGCMSHLTGVAAGTLGVYLRWAAHSKFPGPLTNQHSNTRNKKTSEKKTKFAEHHIYMRKMMQKQNDFILVTDKHVDEHARGISMTTSGVFLIVVVVISMFGYGNLTKSRLLNKWYVLRRRKTNHVI